MKKIFTLVIAFALVLSMAACSKTATPGPSTTSPSPSLKTPTTSSPSASTTTPSTSSTSPSSSSSSSSASSSSSKSSSSASPSKSAMAGNYKDGTYSAKGDPWSKGQEEAVVTIKNGKIADINLKRLDTKGTEVDYSLFNGQVHNGAKYPNLKDFKVTMAKNMISKQSAKVDTIAGATTTTKNWTIATQRALDKAKK